MMKHEIGFGVRWALICHMSALSGEQRYFGERGIRPILKSIEKEDPGSLTGSGSLLILFTLNFLNHGRKTRFAHLPESQ